MNSLRRLLRRILPFALLSAAALGLSGCVAYPVGGYYGEYSPGYDYYAPVGAVYAASGTYCAPAYYGSSHYYGSAYCAPRHYSSSYYAPSYYNRSYCAPSYHNYSYGRSHGAHAYSGQHYSTSSGYSRPHASSSLGIGYVSHANSGGGRGGHAYSGGGHASHGGGYASSGGRGQGARHR